MAVLDAPPARRRFPALDDRHFLVDRYVHQEMTLQQIAREIGCSLSAVAKALSDHQIKARRFRPEHRARLRASAKARHERERAERQRQQRLEQEKRTQQLEDALKLLGPADPPRRLLVLLQVARRRGDSFPVAWRECLELATTDVLFSRTWRETLDARPIRDQWRLAYLKVGKPLRLPDGILGRDTRGRDRYLA